MTEPIEIIKEIQLTQTAQVFPLNKELINFDLTISITSKESKRFELSIVESERANDPKLEFKKIDSGTISANIVADQNIYKEYVMILKSETPNLVAIKITIKPIKVKVKKNYLGYILVIAGIVIVCAIIAFFLFKKQPKKIDEVVEAPNSLRSILAQPIIVNGELDAMLDTKLDAMLDTKLKDSTDYNKPKLDELLKDTSVPKINLPDRKAKLLAQIEELTS